MDYDKLIEDLHWWAAYCGQPCGCLTSRCILDNAAIAIETLCADLAHITAERDLAIEYVRGQCKYCKHNFDCTSRKGPHKNCWEWRGIEED